MKRINEKEYQYVKEVLDTQFETSKGSIMTQRLEKTFAEKFGADYAISFINGTQDMHAVLEAWGIGMGDEVIVPPLTMSSTTFAVLQCGATPIFADVCEDTFLISPESIEERITERTKAIITVSLYGLMPRMDEIMAIAKKHNLYVLEDNAECVMATYKGKKIGSYGHAASYSFQSSKHLTAGEGGMITTNDPELADKVRRVASLGYAGVGAKKGKITKADIQDPNYFRHVTMGWNYRMSELCAAVALAQVENMEKLVQCRIDSANLFLKEIARCDWLVPQYVAENATNTYWTVVVKLIRDDISWYDFKNKFVELGGDGIYAAWQLTYLEPMFQKMQLLGKEKYLTVSSYPKGLCPVAEYLQPRLLQFQTNYFDIEDAKKQADILGRTIDFFNK